MPSELIDEDHSSHVCPRARAQRMRFSTKSRTATGLTYSLSLLGLSQGLFEVTNINVGKGDWGLHAYDKFLETLEALNHLYLMPAISSFSICKWIFPKAESILIILYSFRTQALPVSLFKATQSNECLDWL